MAAFFDGNQVTHSTSIAAPHVTGAASLLWEKDLTKSNEFIRQLINESAEGTEIPENTVEAESFEEVNTDEAYVEGRWGGSNHQAAVTTGSSRKGFSTTAINIIKQGAVYPDQENSKWRGGYEHPWWHGRWKTTNDTVADKKAIWNVNYVAVLEMVSEIAIAGGEIKPYMKDGYINGLDSNTYNELIKDIRNLNEKRIKHDGSGPVGNADKIEHV